MHLKSSLAALGIASIVATGLGAVPSVAASGNLGEGCTVTATVDNHVGTAP